MLEISENLREIRERMNFACLRVGRDSAAVKLIAVSKTFSANDIQEAVDAGEKIFGESRQQEAAPKIEVLSSELEWHFIGRVQSNKVRKILPLFDYVHAVDSLKLAGYIDGVAADLALRPKIFLQVNQSGEESKGGFSVSELQKEIHEIAALKHLEVVGLMTIPPAVEDPESVRHWFAEMRMLRDEIIRESGINIPFLSMGMSGDFEVAIEEGATHVRVGSAIFGRRAYKISGELG
ncbi:MAG: YggS family pyridoxal phosphate-dependent enzyme [Verrucomicrobiota bacterium]